MLSHSHKKTIGAVCLLFVLSLLAAAVPTFRFIPLSIPASAAENLPSTSGADYSNPDSEATIEISASAFVARLTEGTLAEAEVAYLDSLPSDQSFRYNSAIPPRAVEVTYELNTLTVTASPHTYTAVNGERVTWYPVSACIGESAIPLAAHGEDGTMKGSLGDIPEASGARVEIRYACTIAVPAAISEPFLNAAWNYTDRLVSEQAAYDAHVAAYQAYCTYLSEKAAYDLSLIDWENYLVAKEKYDRLYATYAVYEQEMAVYRERLAAYEAYTRALEEYKQKQAAYEAAYAAYVAKLDAYNAALPAYERNQAEIARVLDVLASLDSAFEYNSRGKQLYATLMGDTVATVVNRKSELVAIGCDPNAIDTADNSSHTLKTLLSQYKNLQGLPARFAFYQEHYAEINRHFGLLYGSLRALYDYEPVKSTLITYEKLERYIEFLSQLYVITTGLDDTLNRTPPEEWVIYGAYDRDYYGNRPHRYNTELEPNQLPPDKNNADPAGITCPTAHLPRPVRPTLSVTKPTCPEEVTCPVQPDPVIKPVEPTPMTRPVEPTPVSNPGEPSIAPAYTALQQELMAAYKDGTLARRDAAAASPLVFESVCGRQISLQYKHPVEFYDYDGQTLLYRTELDADTPIVYPNDPPTRPDTDSTTYTFVGWKDQDGNLFDADRLGVVDEPQEFFYASYAETRRHYRVTWRINGTDTATDLPYGTIPVFDGTPQRESDAEHDYVFAGWRLLGEDGWSLNLPAVLGDVTYEAVFEPVTRRYTITWVYSQDDHTSTQWAYGTLPSPDKTPARSEDDRYLYEFVGWDTEPSAVTGDVTYTALYNALPLLPSADGTEPQAPVIQDDAYVAAVPDHGLQVDRLLALALLRDRTISLTAADGTLSLQLNHAVITNLSEAGCTHIHIRPKDNAQRGVGEQIFSIRFLNAAGADILLDYPATIRLSCADAYTRVYARPTDDADFAPLPYTAEGDHVAVKLDRGMTLRFIGEYPITLAPCEDAIWVMDRTHAFVGDTVTLSLTFSGDLQAVVTVTGISGKTYAVAVTANGQYTFVMPDEPVTVSADLARKTFTVTFMVDGVVISEEVYHQGDTVRVPADPEKTGEGNTVYTFIGWSPLVTVVSEDVVYTANFRESLQGDNNSYIPDDTNNRLYLLFIEAGLLLALLIGIPVGIVLLIKRRRKKKRAAREQASDAETPPSDPASNPPSDSNNQTV